ncbi:hypothetical protein AX15_006739 [Amanita polypyramis BW_CC]|nr:hypothetical protein AX15_006739 [Amanita polypyramis BW_CC]
MHFTLVLAGLATAAIATPHPYYRQTFYDLSGATEASDYLTYTLVSSVAGIATDFVHSSATERDSPFFLLDCFAKCNTVQGCNFVNTYHDVNGKNGSPLLTCSLYKYCHYASDAINRGGQTQPDGSVNYITDSDGWCKY